VSRARVQAFQSVDEWGDSLNETQNFDWQNNIFKNG
jgi:hypothetical protein